MAEGAGFVQSALCCGRLAAISARTYRHNLRRVTHMFLLWLDGDGLGSGQETLRPQAYRPSRVSGGTQVIADGLDVYSFPLRASMFVTLLLPPDLTAAEADRLTRSVSALAIEP